MDAGGEELLVLEVDDFWCCCVNGMRIAMVFAGKRRVTGRC